jgi:hypothetical protein
MSSLIAAQPSKPNRLDTEKWPKKDTNKDYHASYAKWAITSAQTSDYSLWLERIQTNKRFYKGDQWKTEEDLEAFLSDTSGQTRNRIKVVHNIIRPMVEQYRGNASILKINASAKSKSKLSVNRRDLSLSERIFKTELANEFPGLGVIMRGNGETEGKDPSIGQTEAETTQIFENLYVDAFVPQINSLLKYVAELNDFAGMQMKVALNLALSGLIATEGYEHAGHQRFRVIESEDCLWDTDARLPDLSDADFVGHVHPMGISSVLERYQPTTEEARALENYASTSNNGTFYADTANTRQYSTGRVPVYKIYWKDVERIEYGFVEDEWGYPKLTKINHKEPGEESPKYTDADLIDPPDSAKNRELFRGDSKKRLLFLEHVRSCSFIPGEVIASPNKEEAPLDIVLEYGKEHNQETEYYDLSGVKFPMKFQTWGYVDGEVFSPVDDAINPQRFINRIMSVTEQLINNSGGSGMIIDEDAIDPNSAGDIYNDSKEGKTITVRTKGKGVPNTVGYYDNTPKPGVYGMLGIVPTLKQMVQDTTGVNEALKGESTGSDQLVGVTELLIQRGSLMQEPFYSAVTDLFIQMYQHIATVGKRMYIDNERELAIITGDEGVLILQMSRDLYNEDFRVFVTRENDEALLRSQANSMLEIFFERQLIDEKIFANLYDRSTPTDVTMALRSQVGLRAEAARIAAKQAQELAGQEVSAGEFLEERRRGDTINAQDQQERMGDKQIAAKQDMQITDAAIQQELNAGNVG